MRLNTFKCLSLSGALALIALGCSDPVGSETDPTQPLTPSPQTIAPILQGELVFFENGQNGYGIFVANSDGVRLRRIGPQGALDIDPAVSRDGKRIAYAGAPPNADWDIYDMNADGSNRVRLTNTPGADDRPAWSPDGKRIAFMSGLDFAMPQIYVVNADGTGLTRLTDSNGNYGSPEWSPDGSQIVFDSDSYGWENKGIFSMNPDGTNVSQLTSGYRDRQPTWSPDGRRIAFVREIDGVGLELFVMNADGSDPKQLTYGVKTVSDPAWSPDGTSIAFGFVSASMKCVDSQDGEITLYPCGHDVMRLSLNGVIDPLWVLKSASNAAWQR